ncbi:MAG TPA: CPBP family intramembrane metalloprotease [Anaerolineae bacterium]|nr:CPBP family intramembrane metalloprotease [Anaerolineae bacterium]
MATLLRARLGDQTIPLRWATWIILSLCMIYIAFNIAFLGTAASEFFGFIPGMLGVLVLSAAGFTRRDCYLRVAPISKQGRLIYVVLTLLVLGSMIPLFIWRGFDWVALLLYAPATAISQELFFRSALLPALTKSLKGRSTLALLLHTALFGLWHAGVFRYAPLWAGVAVILVPTLSGLGWGWQARKDETAFWAMVQHTFFQMFMRLSSWG